MSSQPNNLIQSLTNTFSEDIPLNKSDFSSTLANNSFSVVNFFSSITWQTWIIIILLLALLGLNIFVYLAKGTENLVNILETIFGPFLKLIGYSTISTTKQTIETSATGATTSINAVADTSINALDKLKEIGENGQTIPVLHSQSKNLSNLNNTNTSTQINIPSPSTSNISSQYNTGEPVQTSMQGGNWNSDSLEKALNSAKNSNEPIEPYDSNLMHPISGKVGWCFVGDDIGNRNCAEVGLNDVCMSGDIFPTKDVCINPNLRA
jgi:hypothetical protein